MAAEREHSGEKHIYFIFICEKLFSSYLTKKKL